MAVENGGEYVTDPGRDSDGRGPKAAADAQTFERMRENFVAVFAHRLRTPLSTIMMAAQLLQADHPDNPEVAEAVATILESVKAQARIIEELLDISRILAGRVGLDYQMVDLAGLVESALADMAQAAADKGVELAPPVLVRPADLRADPVRARQILQNLLSNAVRFTPAGGRVGLRLDRLDEQFRITVSDTGKGVAAEELPFVFEPVAQRDPAVLKPGRHLGVGLAVVRRLAELHGGTVQAHSDGAGKGASFIVFLPIKGPG